MTSPDGHRETSASDTAATSQITLPEDVCTTVDAPRGYEQRAGDLSRVSLTDMVFQDSWRQELGTVTGNPDDGDACVR